MSNTQYRYILQSRHFYKFINKLKIAELTKGYNLIFYMNANEILNTFQYTSKNTGHLEFYHNAQIVTIINERYAIRIEK